MTSTINIINTTLCSTAEGIHDKKTEDQAGGEGGGCKNITYKEHPRVYMGIQCMEYHGDNLLLFAFCMGSKQNKNKNLIFIIIVYFERATRTTTRFFSVFGVRVSANKFIL